jgi:hypothetical protein
MATCPRAARWRRARTGIGAAAAFRLRSRCTRRSSTADRERAMLLRCSRADADELANARVTEADASARAAALELELDTVREDSPNPRKPSPSYMPPPTHPGRAHPNFTWSADRAGPPCALCDTSCTFFTPFVRARITPTPQVSIRSDTFFRQDGHRLWQTRGARATRDGARGTSRVSRRDGGRRAGLRLCAKWLSAPCAARPSLSPQSPKPSPPLDAEVQQAAAFMTTSGAAGARPAYVMTSGTAGARLPSSRRPRARRPQQPRAAAASAQQR